MAVNFIQNQEVLKNEIQRVRKSVTNVWVVLGFRDIQFDSPLNPRHTLCLSVIDRGIGSEYERVLTPQVILYLYINIGSFQENTIRKRHLIYWIGEDVSEETVLSYSNCFATIEQVIPYRESISVAKKFQDIYTTINSNEFHDNDSLLKRYRSVSSQASETEGLHDRPRTRSVPMETPVSENSRKHRNLKVIIIGDVGTGKTSIAQFLHNGQTAAVRSPVCLDVFTKRITVENRIVTLDIIDTAGQERFNALPSSYYRNANGVVLVYSCTDKESFNNLSLWLNRAKQCTMDCLPVFILLGNKRDSQRVVTTKEGADFAAKEGIFFLETSVSNNGENIDIAFKFLVREFVSLDRNFEHISRGVRTRTCTHTNQSDVRIVPTRPTRTATEPPKSGCCED